MLASSFTLLQVFGSRRKPLKDLKCCFSNSRLEYLKKSIDIWKMMKVRCLFLNKQHANLEDSIMSKPVFKYSSELVLISRHALANVSEEMIKG